MPTPSRIHVSLQLHSFADAHALWTERERSGRKLESIKLARNTYLRRGPSQADLDAVLPAGTCEGEPLYYSVRLHQTNIVTYLANGDVSLDTGGWRTSTTRERMRACFPGRPWASDAHVKRRPFLYWSLKTKLGVWTVCCERISFAIGDDYCIRTPVKSYVLERELTLQRAPRTQGGFRLKREEVQS